MRALRLMLTAGSVTSYSQPTPSFGIVGTPAGIVWAGENPASRDVFVENGTTAACLFWAYFGGSTGGMTSVTLNGVAPDHTVERDTDGVLTGTGAHVWFNPPAGSLALDPDFDVAPSEGPTSAFACVAGTTAAVVDSDTHASNAGNAVSVTLTTTVGDLVIKFDQHFAAGPSNTAGWTSQATTSNNGEAARLASIIATGTTQVCPSEDEEFSTIAALAFTAA